VFDVEHRVEVGFTPGDLEGVGVEVFKLEAVLFEAEDDVLDAVCEVVFGFTDNEVGDDEEGERIVAEYSRLDTGEACL